MYLAKDEKISPINKLGAIVVDDHENFIYKNIHTLPDWTIFK
jgi:hypothetical protein